MKTAISLPDELFEALEKLVRCSRRSRSEVYAEALREYLARHTSDEVTGSIDAVIDRIGEQPADPFTATAASRTLAATEW